MKHRVVILDEPTSFIDQKTEKDIHQAILDLKQTSTVIVIAHRLSTIKIADEVLVLNDDYFVEHLVLDFCKRLNRCKSVFQIPANSLNI